MNELIPITQTNDNVQAVMGRDLHKFLEIKEPYTDWLPRMVEYGFSAGQDFFQKNLIGQDKLGRRRETIGHIISLDMAKEISMIQRTDKGKQARRYFIEVEKQFQTQAAPASALSEEEVVHKALQITYRKVQELETKVEQDAPKVEYHDTFVADEDALSFRTVASTLNIQEAELRKLLIDHKWIYRETSTRYSPSKGRVVARNRYSEYAGKKPYFYRHENHDVPRFRGEVMHTLKFTPIGAQAVSKAVRKWATQPSLTAIDGEGNDAA